MPEYPKFCFSTHDRDSSFTTTATTTSDESYIYQCHFCRKLQDKVETAKAVLKMLDSLKRARGSDKHHIIKAASDILSSTFLLDYSGCTCKIDR